MRIRLSQLDRYKGVTNKNVELSPGLRTCPPWGGRAKSKPQHTRQGDIGGPFHFCTSLTFLDLIYSFAAGALKNFGKTLPEVKSSLLRTT